MSQDNQSKQSIKLDIFVVNVTNPYEFQFYQAATEKIQQKKLNGSMLDISPAESVYDRTRLFSNVTALEWTNDAIESFKNLVMDRKLAFEIKKINSNGIYYGKLYLKVSNGEIDVSEIMVQLGKAYNSNSRNQLMNATESSDRENVEVVPDVQPERNSKSDEDSSSSVTLVSNVTIKKSKTHTNGALESEDDTDFESRLMSACSDDSSKTEDVSEAATFAAINHSDAQSNGISSNNNIDAIPAYLLEDDISEAGAEKYSIPRNSDLFREVDIKNETDEMKKLLKDAKRMNNTFKLLFIRNAQNFRSMFHHRVNKHLKQMRSYDSNDVQERMWSNISNEAIKNIHIVGDTHYIMYLPPICDSIYKLQFQRQKGVPWKGPEALIIVSDTKEAKEIHKFCSIILGTNAVCLDLNTPSNQLSIKDPKIKKCAILIVRLNRLANLMAIGEFNNCKYMVIDGVHRLWPHEKDSLIKWLKQNRKSFSQILTSKHYVKVFENNTASLAIQNNIDCAVIAGMQFTLYQHTEIEKTNLFLNIGPCVIVSPNEKSQKDLMARLRKFLPNAKIKCISFYTDKDIERGKKGNFKILVHNGLPESFEMFEHRFEISEQSGSAKTIILINNKEETLKTKQKQILEILRDRNILSDPHDKHTLMKDPRNRFQIKIRKIEIVSVLTPEEYKIRWKSHDVTEEATVRLSDISPKLKYGWDSSDSFRVRGLLLCHPFSDLQIEAYLYNDGEQIVAEDMLIHENGEAIILKKWLCEQEIIS